MRVQAFALVVLIVISIFPAAYAADGLAQVESQHSAKVTMDRLEAAVLEKQMKVFVRIDHAAGAASIGEGLRPTELLVFGSPKGGTPFMKCAQTVGIDLPLKALVWQDGNGKVWLSYNDPAYLAKRHDSVACPVVPGMSKALSELAAAATGGN